MTENSATTLRVDSLAPAPSYGIDAPNVIRNFFVLGGALVALGLLVRGYVGSGLFWWGAAWVVTASLMLLYALRGKFAHRDRMLAMIPWNGSETVLDVGTGRGLLMIGAAKKLTNGKSIGIDIWNAEDLSNNAVENTLRNAAAEGVGNKIELRSEDVRSMSFPNGTFDVVLSNLCVHNLYEAPEREKACAEILRVLKPGGTALVSDFRHTKQYAEAFARAGAIVEKLGPYWTSTFPPLTVVKVVKP